jgi:Uma2 family endonuclease
LYRASTPHIGIGDNTTVRLDLDDEPQPDVVLLLEPGDGGNATISTDDWVENAPELVAEVASTSASFDLHTKLHVYRRNKIREYLVWRVSDREIDWFVLRGSKYERPVAGQNGVLRSEVFPGLWLPTAAMVAGEDLTPVIATLQSGLASPEHAAFVARLAATAPSPRNEQR